jgi:hypothetical protein
MHGHGPDFRRRIAAAILAAYPTFDFLVGLISGSKLRDLGEAGSNVLRFVDLVAGLIPQWASAMLFFSALGLLAYGPVIRALSTSPSKAVDTSQVSVAIRKPGELGTAPLHEVIAERKMIRDGHLKVEGIDENTYPPPYRCPLCFGSGKRNYEECLQCAGYGELPGEVAQFPECKICEADGTGRNFPNDCVACCGLGRRVIDQELLRHIKGPRLGAHFLRRVLRL